VTPTVLPSAHWSREAPFGQQDDGDPPHDALGPLTDGAGLSILFHFKPPAGFRTTACRSQPERIGRPPAPSSRFPRHLRSPPADTGRPRTARTRRPGRLPHPLAVHALYILSQVRTFLPWRFCYRCVQFHRAD